MFGLGMGEILVILVLALLFIGPKKIPELARSLGKGIREFQNAKDELMNEINKDDSKTEDEVTPLVAQVEKTEAIETNSEKNTES